MVYPTMPPRESVWLRLLRIAARLWRGRDDSAVFARACACGRWECFYCRQAAKRGL